MNNYVTYISVSSLRKASSFLATQGTPCNLCKPNIPPRAHNPTPNFRALNSINPFQFHNTLYLQVRRYTIFHPSAPEQLRSSLFRVVTQRILVAGCHLTTNHTLCRIPEGPLLLEQFQYYRHMHTSFFPTKCIIGFKYPTCFDCKLQSFSGSYMCCNYV
jgi:hypothetical protein